MEIMSDRSLKEEMNLALNESSLHPFIQVMNTLNLYLCMLKGRA